MSNTRKIDKDTSNHNIKWGIILTFVTLLFSLLNAFVLTPFILKYAGDSNYGFYSFALSITTWLPVLINALTASFIKFASLDQKNRGTTNRINSLYFKIISLFCFIGSIAFLSILIILFISNVKLGQYTTDENKLIYFLLLLSSINTFSSIFFSFFTLFINYKQKFIFAEVIKISTAFLAFILKIVLILFIKKIWIIVVIDLLLTILFGFITFYYAKYKINIPLNLKIKLKENRLIIKEIIIFSSFLLLNNLAEQINNHLDVTILGLFVNAQSVTTYQLSFTFCTYISNIPVAIATLFIPRVNEYYAKGETEKLNSLFLKVSHLQCLFLFLILGGYIVCGNDFIKLWLNGQHNDVYIYSLPLLIIHLLPLSVNISIEIQRAYNKHKFRAISFLIIAIINAVTSTLCVLFLPKQYAIWSCITCTVISKFIGVWILFTIYNQKVIKLPMLSYFKDASILLLKTSICIAAAYGINILLHNNKINTIGAFLITGFSFVILYFFLILLFDKEFKLFLKERRCKN